MDNLGDWLYIVFLAIAVVSGLFSEKKKKRSAAKPVKPQQQVDTSPGSDQGKGFWEILQEMQNGQQPPKRLPKQKPEKKQVAAKSTKAASVIPSPFLSGESIGSSPMQHSNILFEEPIETDHHISREDFHIQDVDEVRKAIIYSEILNRKY